MPKLVYSRESIVHRLRKTVNCQLPALSKVEGSTVNCHRGFSLIEILVVISVVSLLGLLGFSSLRGTQASARDAQRKVDFEAIETALELFYQAHGEYPNLVDGNPEVPGPIGWWHLAKPDPWIHHDRDGVSGGNDYDIIIKNLPRDPLDPVKYPGDWHVYSFPYMAQTDSADISSGCPPRGQWIAIWAMLEDKDDPDSLKNKDVKWCDGSSLQASVLMPSFGSMYIKVLVAK